MKWRFAACGLAAAMLTCVGCWGRGCGLFHAVQPGYREAAAPHIPNLPHFQKTPEISAGINVLDWIVGMSFLGAFLCIIATVAVGTLFGLGSAVLRRLAMTFVCTGVGSLLLKAFGVALADWTSRYTWIVGALALVGGILAASAFGWGHVKWIEKRLNIDVDRDGRIGE